jgi:hypothetical protein
VTVWNDSSPLVVGSALASRVPPGAERGPLPYLFFSGVLDEVGSAMLRARVQHVLADGLEDYTAARRAIGAAAEVIYLVHAPHGDVALVVLEAPGAQGVYDALGGALRPFHQWLERRALEQFGLRPGHPGPAGYGDQSEVIFRWHP